MLETISDNVFLKTLDESPKFRFDNINASIHLRPHTVNRVIEIYDLNLVKEIYYQGISSKSYNGNKRNRLKSQEILLIKKIKISELAKKSLDDVFKNALGYEQEFKDYFQMTEDLEENKQLVKHILDDFYNDYIQEVE